MLVIRRIVLGLVFTWFFFGSLGHFFDATFFAGLVPSYVPFPHAAVAITGACELLGAVGLLIAKTRTAAGLGLFVLTLCVTPVNFNMWRSEEHTSELQSLMRISYAVFCLKKTKITQKDKHNATTNMM